MSATPPSGDPGCSVEEGCITCGDVAIPLEVLLVDESRGLALCRDERDRRESVEIALVGEVRAGDGLLVHAGTAIAHLGTAAASGIPGREAEEMPASGIPGREAEEMPA